MPYAIVAAAATYVNVLKGHCKVIGWLGNEAAEENLAQRTHLWLATQRYTYRVLQTIQMKLILLYVWAEPALLGSAKIALKFKYEI